MPKNLETADTWVKLTLALTMVISYFAGLIHGPLADIMLVLSLVIVVIFIARIIITKFLID